MILNAPTAVAIYFLIGLFIAGFYMAFDDNSPGMFTFILFLWPIVLSVLAFAAVVAIPVIVGRWIGDRIKDWL